MLYEGKKLIRGPTTKCAVDPQGDYKYDSLSISLGPTSGRQAKNGKGLHQPASSDFVSISFELPTEPSVVSWTLRSWQGCCAQDFLRHCKKEDHWGHP